MQTKFKSASFNRTIIMNEETKRVISRLIETEFFAIKESEWWREGERNELIRTAINLGLIELADDLTLWTS